jgi:CRP-like cAMP-binding protein
VPSLAGCTPRQLLDLGRRLELAALHEGSVLVAEGDTLRWCMVVVAGHALVTHRDRPDGVLGPGDWLGASKETCSPAVVTVQALEPMTALVADRRAVGSLLSGHPGLRAREAATAALAAGASVRRPASHTVDGMAPAHEVMEADVVSPLGGTA